MKKLLSILMLLVAIVTGAKASTETVSWTSMATSNHDANKAGVASDATALTPAAGVVTSLETNGSTTKVGSTTYYRYSGFGVSVDNTKYFQYSFSVAAGYTFTPTKITVGWAPNGGKAVCFDVYAGTNASNLVKIGNLIHSSDNTYAEDDITTFTALGENTDFTIVRLVPYGKASSIILNNVVITGTLASSGPQSAYTKPEIVVGDYNKSTGKYPVTFNVQNEEDGKITYTIGDDDPVSNVESGTKVNVAPETDIVAFVSGATYDPSPNEEVTTPAMPQLAVPTVSVGSYNFDKNTYPITITTNEAGVTLNYTINGGAVQVYSNAIDVAAGATLVAYATETNMTQSENVEKIIPTAPTGGTATTPTTSGTYTSNVSYVMDAITIPGACIAGQISSGSTPINGSIKGRTNQPLSDNTTSGFYVTVNAGCKVTGISIQACSNGDAFNCTGVYVDGDLDKNLLSSSVALPKAAKNGETETIAVSDIEATDRIEFTFSATTQTQMIITVTSEVAGEVALNDVSGYNYGFAGFCAPQNFTVANGKAYKAVVTNNKIVLTELEGIVPANEGVVIAGDKGANATISYTSASATADVTDNNLHGTTVRTLTSELKGSADKFLTLQKSTSKFIQYTGEYFPANRAYLLLDANSAPQSLEMVFDNVTAIKTIDGVAEAEIKDAPAKVIKNGKLYIGNYNVAGQLVK